MNVPILGQKPDLGPQIRLVLCGVCGTIEEIPDYEGRPDNDHLLEITVEKHKDAAGVRHAPGALVKVPVSAWSRPEVRAEIIKQIRIGNRGMDEFDQNWSDSKSNFQEDALACYQQHLRPQGQCPDYMSDKKRLLPDTKKERKDLGMARADAGGPKSYLCMFCPVAVYNQRKIREQKGLYA